MENSLAARLLFEIAIKPSAEEFRKDIVFQSFIASGNLAINITTSLGD